MRDVYAQVVADFDEACVGIIMHNGPLNVELAVHGKLSKSTFRLVGSESLQGKERPVVLFNLADDQAITETPDAKGAVHVGHGDLTHC